MRLRPLPTAGVLAHLGLTALVAVLAGVGVLPRWPGLVHLVALPPLDVLADARWLLVSTTSWPWFVAGLILTAAVRVTVLALLLGRDGRPRWRLAVAVYVVAVVPALVAGQLDFIAHAVLYSRLYGGALIVAAATYVLLAAAPWTGEQTLRSAMRASLSDGLRLPALAAHAAVLLLIGAVAELGGVGATLVMLPMAALTTLVMAAHLAGSRARRPVVAAAATIVIGVVLAATVVFTRGEPWPSPPPPRDGSLIVMSGINSSSGEGAIFETHPELLGYRCDQTFYYSYAGTGRGQPQGDARCPIRTGAPYVPEDTQRPFAEQVELLAEQTADLEPPVVVVGHSQAAWVAWQAAAEQRLPRGTAIVLAGPFPSSPLTYPPPGENGVGRVGGDIMRLLEPVPDLVDFDFVVDAPLARELLATPDASTEVFDERIASDVAVLSVPSTTDLPLMPDGWQVAGANNACPIREAHPYLPITPAFYDVAASFLAGVRHRQSPCTLWADAYRVVTQPLGVPPAGR